MSCVEVSTKINAVRLNFYHWCKTPSSAFSKKFQRRPHFLHVFSRALSDLQLCFVQLKTFALLDHSAALDTVDELYPTSSSAEVIRAERLGTCVVQRIWASANSTCWWSFRDDDHPVRRAAGSVLGPILFMLYTADVCTSGRAVRLQRAPVRWPHAALRLVPTWKFRITVSWSWRLCWRRGTVDEFQSSAAERRKDGIHVVCVATASPPSPSWLTDGSVSRSCSAHVDQWPDLGVHLDNDMSMHTHVTQLVRSCYVTAQHSSVAATFSIDDFSHLVHYFKGGLLQCCSGRSTTMRPGSSAVCRQCSCSPHDRCPQIRPCDAASEGATLATSTTRVQYKLCVLVHRCLNGTAPRYMTDLSVSVSCLDNLSVCGNVHVTNMRYKLLL